MGKELKNIIVISPVYNEEKYLSGFIETLMKETQKLPPIKKIIFVDDGSTDSSNELLDKFKKKFPLIEVLTLKNNVGKGRALRFGFQRAKELLADGVVFLDSDQQHQPQYLTEFVDNLSDYPIVFGYRHLAKSSPYFRRFGNEIAKIIMRNLFHIRRKDLLCGFMAFRRDVFSYLNWQSNDYGVETEISTIVGKNNLPFKEINIKNIYLDRKKGVNLLHAFLILMRIPFWYLSPSPEGSPSGHPSGALITVFLIFVYLILTFKNPFGIRSLVVNLEPFPDTLYYSVPTWNFVHGLGFNMKIFEWQAKQIAPPLYSLYLIPFFVLFRDVRSFYLANMVLMVATITLFLLWLRKIFKSDWLVVGLVGFLLVTNFYFYHLPSLLIAENLTIFFVVLALYLLTDNNAWLTSFVGVGFWLIKFSNLPLGLTFYFLNTLRVYKNKKYWFLVSFWLSVFIIYLTVSKIFVGHKNLTEATSFSINYFKDNFNFYLKNLFGLTGQFLWFRQKMISPLIGLVALIGLIIGLLTKQLRKTSIELLIFIFSLVSFISFFYAKDTRFIIAILPLWLTGVGIFFYLLNRKFKTMLTIIFVMVYLFNQSLIVSLKNQISLNLKYKEDPWNYLAVKNFNQFFSRSENEGSHLGTFLPPFYVNFFSSNKYQYLPVIEGQDFFQGKGGFLEQMGIKSVKDYYRKLLRQNKRVFVSNYYAANLVEWQKYFDNLKTEFNLELKQKGCYEVCNIYELKLR